MLPQQQETRNFCRAKAKTSHVTLTPASCLGTLARLLLSSPPHLVLLLDILQLSLLVAQLCPLVLQVLLLDYPEVVKLLRRANRGGDAGRSCGVVAR